MHELTPFRRVSGVWVLEVPEDVFVRAMAHVSSDRAATKTTFARMRHGVLLLEDTGEDVRVFSEHVSSVREIDTGALLVSREQSRCPYHAFPSDSGMHECHWVLRTTSGPMRGGARLVVEESRPLGLRSDPGAGDPPRAFRVYVTANTDPASWANHARRLLDKLGGAVTSVTSAGSRGSSLAPVRAAA